MTPDLQFCNHGSLVTMYPISASALIWVAENIPEDAMTWGDAIVIEPRYLADIVDGARADGLVCEG